MSPFAVAGGIGTAIASAACFGTSAVLQYRATHQVRDRPAGRPGLLVDLFRIRSWRWSVLLAAAGFGLQVLALRLVPLVLVQPLLVTGVLWYVLLSARLYHRAPDAVIVGGTLLCLAGLVTFLALAQPAQNSGTDQGKLSRAVPLLIGLAVAVAVCLFLAGVVGKQWRALPLSVAAGICYGVTAGLVRSLSSHFGAGLGEVLGHWQTWAIVVLGPLGVLLNQNSYQAGRIGAPALAIITVTDPLVSIAVGTIWLGERISGGPDRVAGEVVALAVLAGAVLMLALRAPHVAGTPVPAQSGRPSDPAAEQPGGVEHAG